MIEFHRAMGVPILERPEMPGKERLRLRLGLICEELSELMYALGCSGRAVAFSEQALGAATATAGKHQPDMIEAADALADLDYVIEGTRLELGIDGAPIAAEVHRSNMAKVGGPVREDGKIMKPQGWTPPEIARLLREQGWTP